MRLSFSPRRSPLSAAVLLLVAAILAATAVSAQTNRGFGQVHLSIMVIDPASGQELDRVAPGHTVTLEEGQTVVLRLQATFSGNKSLARPAARFQPLAGGSRVRLARSVGGNSEIRLQAVRLDNPSDREAMTLIGFETDDFGAGAQAGAVAVRVIKAPPMAVGAFEAEVWDPDRQETIGRLAPGQTLALESGQRVQLRMMAVSPNGLKRKNVQAQYRLVTGSDQVSIRFDNQQGWLLVEGRDAGRSGKAQLAYSVGGNLDLRRGVRRQGEFTVVVSDPYRNIGGRTDSSELVTLLYRAILLRKPEEGIVAARSRDIDLHGLEGVQRQAREIAASPESTKLFRPDGFVDHRLEALYLHLLGIPPEEIPAAERRTFTALLKRKQIVSVVEGIIASDRFLFRHGYYEDDEAGMPNRPGARLRPRDRSSARPPS